MKCRFLLVFFTTLLVFCTIEGSCFDPLPFFTTGKKAVSLKRQIPPFDADAPVSEIENIRIEPGDASGVGQYQKDTGTNNITTLAESAKAFEFDQPCISSFTGSSKSYLSHIYPSHNFW